MEFNIISFTPNAEEVCLRCARNDYAPFDLNVATDSFEKVMKRAGGDPEALLKKMIMRGHYGILEHASFTFRAVMSRTCMSQVTRHRYISFDVQSQRYVNFADAPFYYPSEHWPKEAGLAKVKTRKGPTTIDYGTVDYYMKQIYKESIEHYKELVNMGVPEEDARMVLPNGIMCSVTGTMNLRTALHIISMRGAGDAQSEIRELAQHIEDALKVVAPMVHKIWTENQRAIERQKLSP